MGLGKELGAGALVSGIILLVIAWNVVATGVGEIQTAGDVINATGAPLATFFASDGIMVLAFMGAVVLGTLAVLGLSKR